MSSTLPIQEFKTVDDYYIIHQSEIWNIDKSIDKPIIIGQDATLTIKSGIDVNIFADLIVYGELENSGRVFMNNHDIYANSMNMGWMTITGDANYPSHGVIQNNGTLNNVGTLNVMGPDQYPIAPFIVDDLIHNSTVTSQEIVIEGRTVAGFIVKANDQQVLTETNGTFQLSLSLNQGLNEINLSYVDVFDREYFTETLSITFQKDEEATNTTDANASVDPKNDKGETLPRQF